MTNSTQNNETKYYNNSTSSACYINEIKRVQPNRGDAFIAVKASLVDGPLDNPSYENIDLIVKGKQAQEVLESFEGQWPQYSQENRPTIFANIRLVSLGVKAYMNGKQQPAAVLSGRLIKVNFCSINKVPVAIAAQPNQADTAQNAAPETETQPSAEAEQVAQEVPGNVVQQAAYTPPAAAATA